MTGKDPNLEILALVHLVVYFLFTYLFFRRARVEAFIERESEKTELLAHPRREQENPE